MLLPPDLRDWVPKSDSGPLLGNSFCRPPWMAVRKAGKVGVQELRTATCLAFVHHSTRCICTTVSNLIERSEQFLSIGLLKDKNHEEIDKK